LHYFSEQRANTNKHRKVMTSKELERISSHLLTTHHIC